MSRDSELQVFAFRSKKWIDRSSYAVDIAKSEGENLIWKSDGPSRQIRAAVLGPQFSGRSSRTRYTPDERVATDALQYEYNHNARTQLPRLSAARL